jgi:hypothetical protein
VHWRPEVTGITATHQFACCQAAHIVAAELHYQLGMGNYRLRLNACLALSVAAPTGNPRQQVFKPQHDLPCVAGSSKKTSNPDSVFYGCPPATDQASTAKLLDSSTCGPNPAACFCNAFHASCSPRLCIPGTLAVRYPLSSSRIGTHSFCKYCTKVQPVRSRSTLAWQ